MENGSAELARRDTRTKETVSFADLENIIPGLLESIQQEIFNRARAFRDDHITEVNSWDEFVETLETKGGFISAHWDGTSETEVAIKEKTKATIRCIPLDAKEEIGSCVLTGKPSTKRVLFAKAY
jgi:prolyl-tRNA synthetase